MMWRRPFLILAGFLIVGVLAAVGLRTVVEAQDNERSRFVRFVERQISTPDRQIRLGAIDGALSSDVRISSITIADRAGVWLTIEGVHLIWTRTALLRGRLSVDLLEAERIEISRRPQPAQEETPEEAQLQIPELPVEVQLDSLNVPRVETAEGVIGPAATLGVQGAMQLAGGSLDAELGIERLDTPGSLNLRTAFSNETRVLDLNMRLSEPPDGVVANLLYLRGRPAITFAIEGTGPLDNFEANISLAADGDELVSGTTTISSVDRGLRFVTDIGGNLQRLVPRLYADLVDTGSRLAIDATRADSGAISIDRAEITSGVATLDFGAELTPDFFPTSLRLDARLGTESGERVNLPGGGGAASIRSGRIAASLGGAAGQSWVATFDLDELETPLVSAERVHVTSNGLAAGMEDPAARRITFDVSGAADGLSSQDEDVADALGAEIGVEARGSWNAGEDVRVKIARLNNPNAMASFAGGIDRDGLDGRYELSADDLSLFSGLAGQDLDGSIELGADGTIGFGGGTFSLSIDGTGRDLDMGITALRNLLAGETTVSGGIARTADGFRFNDLVIRNDQANARVDGRYQREAVDLTASARLADVAVLTDRASGAAALEARLSGTAERPSVSAAVSGDDLTLMGKPFTDARANFEGTVAGTDVDGELALTGNLDGMPVDATARIASLPDGARAIETLEARAGETTLGGNLTLRADGLYDGELNLDSPDLSAIAPLLLAEASGAVSADIALSVEDGGQSATVEAQARDFRYEQITVSSADVDMAGENLLSAPILSGRASAREVSVGEFRIATVDATAARSGDTTSFSVDAELVEGTFTTAGQLQPVENGFDVSLARLRLEHRGIEATLASPVQVAVREGTVSTPGATLQIGDGRIELSGEVGEAIDLTGRITDLPLSIANAVMPRLALSGTVSGNIEAGGTWEALVADFDVTGRGINARPLRQLGIGDIAFDGNGHLEEETVTLEATTNIGGGRVRVDGSVGKRLDVRAEVTDLPLSIFNVVRPELGLGGTVSGTARATGSLDEPQGTFTLRSQAVSADVLRQAGVSALAVSAEGRFEKDRVTLTTARAEGAGITLQAQGTVPFSGSGLSLSVNGRAPLSLANHFLAERGATLTGTLVLDARVTGSLAAPRFAGTINADGASFSDPETGVRIGNIVLRAGLEGEQLVIRQLTAAVGTGSVSVSGSIGIAPSGRFPADLTIALRQARYDDGRMIAVTVDGDLTLRGPLMGQSVLAGTINVARAEITVPEQLPGGPTMLDVDHSNAPFRVLETLRRAHVGPFAETEQAAGPSGFALDLTIDAPRRIFVRGRGLDAELGGHVTVTGPVSNVRPVGGFTLIRGHIDIIGQRITFDRANITLFGDLDPYLDFVATTQSSSILVTLSVQGQVSDPKITFSSVPELPQDEVLAQLLFGRSIDDLSPVQLAQLAAAAAELSGAGGGTGVFDQIRASTGLDQLDIVAEPGGGAAVEAGRYIAENIYLGVRAGEESSGVTVNLDVTDNIKVRGETGTRDSKVGIFYEREY